MLFTKYFGLLKITCFILLTIILALVFYKFSWIDIEFSRIFYDPNNHQFFLRNTKFTVIVDYIVKIIIVISGLILSAAIINEFYRYYHQYYKRDIKNSKHDHNEHYNNNNIFSVQSKYDFSHAIILLYLSTLFIVYLIVTAHGIKSFFHRARPFSVEEFGGTLDFTPVFVIGSQCITNCSFVSAHASAGFMFFGLVFLLPKEKRKIYIWICITLLGLFFGISRIIEGKHFLSDVVFSGIWTFSISFIIYSWFFKKYLQKQ